MREVVTQARGVVRAAVVRPAAVIVPASLSVWGRQTQTVSITQFTTEVIMESRTYCFY